MLSETVTKSKYESTIEAMKGVIEGNTSLPWQMCDADRKHIQVFTCSKCGNLKRFVEDI
jgi:hypothetical protein